ncbi:MAG: error-prone DNA polymerase, partial [Phycisphaerales bacterium]|nr:error-prone DNA polymerase [Phycisphaerales bacterium]
LRGLRATFDDDRLSLAATCRSQQDDAFRLDQLDALAAHVDVPLVATNDVHHHVPARRPLQDVLTCIREHCTVHDAGFRLHANAERHLKSGDEMARLFASHPAAVARTIAIADRASAFSLDEIRYQYPTEICPPGRTPLEHLRRLTYDGAAGRYPDGIPDRIASMLEHELRLIDDLNYAPYFLTVHDLVDFARSRGILCQGRGAAANSAVCFCLGVTAVDPDRLDLLFERFVSKERDEPPDIDIDFEHERREEVIQYIYGKYGRHRAALTGVVISYRARSAVRDVGKALGLSLDCVDRLAKSMDWWDDGVAVPERLRELGVSPEDRTIRHLIRLVSEIRGFPRHLSQHVGGFVITDGPLSELVPIENAAMPDRTVIEWDKDDIDAMGMLKVDVLGLGMLSCIRRAFDLVREHHGRDLAIATVPGEDPAVYDMIGRADTIGVFQIESRAQMSMLPRLRPRSFYDLVIEVAIVRPGPIQGNMVHPYLRRRCGEETAHYPDDAIRRVLGKTLGVPLFQEQAMAMAIVAAGFTPGEADQLRRAMAAWKRKGDAIYRFRDKLIGGMIGRGYAREFAERCFEQIKGFSEYGFPESHAASFALLVYVSCWLKHHYPAAFAAALINSQPMGFYAPAQIVRDAQAHGVTVHPVDVNHSAWDCTLEPCTDPSDPRRPSPTLRLGLRMVGGLAEADATPIVDAVARHGPFTSIETLQRSAGAPIRALRQLAKADAFRSLGLDRQSALWQIRVLREAPLPVLDANAAATCRAGADSDDDRARGQMLLPFVPEARKVVQDYASVGLTLRRHPVSFIRPDLDALGVTPNVELETESRWPGGRLVSVAGVVLVRQRPATAKGVVFMTIEDETGIANLIFWKDVYRAFRRIARHGSGFIAHGLVQREKQVVHVLVKRLDDIEHLFVEQLRTRSRDFH